MSFFYEFKLLGFPLDDVMKFEVALDSRLPQSQLEMVDGALITVRNSVSLPKDYAQTGDPETKTEYFHVSFRNQTALKNEFDGAFAKYNNSYRDYMNAGQPFYIYISTNSGIDLTMLMEKIVLKDCEPLVFVGNFDGSLRDKIDSEHKDDASATPDPTNNPPEQWLPHGMDISSVLKINAYPTRSVVDSESVAAGDFTLIETDPTTVNTTDTDGNAIWCPPRKINPTNCYLACSIAGQITDDSFLIACDMFGVSNYIDYWIHPEAKKFIKNHNDMVDEIVSKAGMDTDTQFIEKFPCGLEKYIDYPVFSYRISGYKEDHRMIMSPLNNSVPGEIELVEMNFVNPQAYVIRQRALSRERVMANLREGTDNKRKYSLEEYKQYNLAAAPCASVCSYLGYNSTYTPSAGNILDLFSEIKVATVLPDWFCVSSDLSRSIYSQQIFVANSNNKIYYYGDDPTK